MKNIHVLPTDKKTRLFTSDSVLILAGYPATTFKTGKNIYITSDEEIKDGDYYLYLKDNSVQQFIKKHHTKLLALDIQKKIILTTDGDLIKDGVQAPDDEFLEWFVKNPNCEEVEVLTDSYTMQQIFELKLKPDIFKYKIIIPKEEPKKKHIVMLVGDIVNEEPKQETLEEAAEKEYPTIHEQYQYDAFIAGAQWQQDQDKNKYSEEDMIEAAKYGYNFHKTTSFPNQEFEASCVRNTQQWLTTYKKK